MNRPHKDEREAPVMSMPKNVITSTKSTAEHAQPKNVLTSSASTKKEPKNLITCGKQG